MRKWEELPSLVMRVFFDYQRVSGAEIHINESDSDYDEREHFNSGRIKKHEWNVNGIKAELGLTFKIQLEFEENSHFFFE